jgi:hypothetical protein
MANHAAMALETSNPTPVRNPGIRRGQLEEEKMVDSTRIPFRNRSFHFLEFEGGFARANAFESESSTPG